MALRIYAEPNTLSGLYQDWQTAERLTLRQMVYGDKLEIEFGFLERTGQVYTGAVFERIAAAGYSLSIGVYLASDRSTLAYTSSFTDLADGWHKTGILDLTDSRIAAVLTGTTYSAAVIVEIIVTTTAGAIFTVHRGEWTILKQYKSVTPVATPAGEVAATQSWVQATCVPRDGTSAGNPCNGFYMKSDNKNWLIQIDDDGHISPTQI